MRVEARAMDSSGSESEPEEEEDELEPEADMVLWEVGECWREGRAKVELVDFLGGGGRVFLTFDSHLLDFGRSRLRGTNPEKQIGSPEALQDPLVVTRRAALTRPTRRSNPSCYSSRSSPPSLFILFTSRYSPWQRHSSGQYRARLAGNSR